MLWITKSFEKNCDVLDLIIKKRNVFQNSSHRRQQCVVADGYQTTFLSLKKGVPLGSVLGPLLLTIFVNDVGVNVRNKLKPFKNYIVISVLHSKV